eukprot:1348034-Amorphochlora_amoeboformis.AAC.1
MTASDGQSRKPGSNTPLLSLQHPSRRASTVQTRIACSKVHAVTSTATLSIDLSEDSGDRGKGIARAMVHQNFDGGSGPAERGGEEPELGNKQEPHEDLSDGESGDVKTCSVLFRSHYINLDRRQRWHRRWHREKNRQKMGLLGGVLVTMFVCAICDIDLPLPAPSPSPNHKIPSRSSFLQYRKHRLLGSAFGSPPGSGFGSPAPGFGSPPSSGSGLGSASGFGGFASGGNPFATGGGGGSTNPFAPFGTTNSTNPFAGAGAGAGAGSGTGGGFAGSSSGSGFSKYSIPI